MHIVSFMNVSNQQTLSTDSGFIFYNILAEHFVQKGHKFTFVAPEPLHNRSVQYVPKTMGRSKYESRFSFDWDKTKEIIETLNPNVIIINQIELLSNYRALLATLGKHDVRLVGYAHCIPFGFSDEDELLIDSSLNNCDMWTPVVLHFISGIDAADLIYVHSNTAKRFLENIYRMHNKKLDNNKLEIIPPPYDPYMVDTVNTKTRKSIVYNHRINAHYGTDFLTKVVSKLTQDCNISAIILDIMGDRSPERNRMDGSVEALRKIFKETPRVTLTRDGCDRKKYKKILQNATCSLAPHREAHTWSMSCIDSLGLGIPVVSPNFGWFKEFMPADLRYDSEEHFYEIIKKLVNDQSFWEEKSNEAQNLIKGFSPKKTANHFLSSFNKLLSVEGEGRKICG